MSDGIPQAERERLAAALGQNGSAPTAEPFTLYSPEDLRNLPPIRWLIDKVIVFAFIVLYGASGVGKSFLALAWALTVASGLPWLDGSEVVHGWVLYICAEGSGGVVKRLDAWCQDRGVPMPERIRFVTEAVYLDDPPVLARALATIEAMPERPVLIVIDTLARCMIGNENATQDMGAFVRAVDELRKAAASPEGELAAALVVHHTAKKGDDERGNGSLRNASDQMSLLAESGNGLRLEHDKTKDFEDQPPVSLYLARAGELGDSTTVRLGVSGGSDLTHSQRRVLERLSELDGSDKPSVTRLAAICEMNERTYHRALKRLRNLGYIAPEYEGRAVFNALTDAGREALVT